MCSGNRQRHEPPNELIINLLMQIYVVLSNPPPSCICNQSGDVPLAYSLVACEPNVIAFVSNGCCPN
uniref:DNA binding protein n=1 Tax=Solanum tuberosum TaxID=4113 RepID=M1C294_SOLTU